MEVMVVYGVELKLLILVVDSLITQQDLEFLKDPLLETKSQTWNMAFITLLLEYYKIYKQEGRLVIPKEVDRATERENVVMISLVNLFTIELKKPTLHVKLILPNFIQNLNIGLRIRILLRVFHPEKD